MFVDVLKKFKQRAFVAINRVCRSQHVYSSMNEREREFTVATYYDYCTHVLQDSSTLAKCVIVMTVGSICKSVVSLVFRFCF